MRAVGFLMIVVGVLGIVYTIRKPPATGAQ